MYQILLFVLVAFFLVYSYIKYKNFYNPIFLFNAIWGFIFVLYDLKLSNLLDNLSNGTVLIFIAMFVTFNIISLFISLVFDYFNSRITKNEIKSDEGAVKNNFLNKKVIYFLFIIWFCIISVEIIYCKGVPLVWLLLKTGKTYFDFGIKGLHGFANAIGLTVTLMAYSYYEFNKKDKTLLCLISAVLFIYVLLISRQVIISACIEMAFVYIFKRSIQNKKIKKRYVIIGALIAILAFGIIGNIRTGGQEFYRVSSIKYPIPLVFSGFYWFYMYLVMTVSNINHVVTANLTNLGQATQGMDPRQFLTSPNFTVSGFMSKNLITNGIWGVVWICAEYSIVSALSYNYLNKFKSMIGLLLYAVIVHIILLSFFVDMMSYKPVNFQLVLLIAVYIFEILKPHVIEYFEKRKRSL